MAAGRVDRRQPRHHPDRLDRDRRLRGLPLQPLSLLGVVANLLGVPLTGFWIMPWGLLAMLLMPLGLERFALVPMGWGVEGLNAIARHVAELAAGGDPGAVDAGRQPVADHSGRPVASACGAGAGGSRDCRSPSCGLLLGPGTAPDLLMSEDGRVLGLRDGQGMVQVASARVDRFVTDNWARRSGQEGAQPLAGERRRGGRRPGLPDRASAAGARGRGASRW